MSHTKQTKTPPTQLLFRFPLSRGGLRRNKSNNILPKNQLPKNKTFLGFTLVELIVVIVILAILATIAFLSFNSYSSSSRDSVRLSDINSVNKALELYNINAAKYPDPTGVYMTVVYSGGAIFEQGKLGDSVITAVQKMSKKPVDPLKNTEYTYSVNMTNTTFQLKADLETKQTTTGYNDGNNVITRNEIVPTSSFGAEGNGVEGIYENNSSSLLSNVFNGLKDISTTLRSAQYDDNGDYVILNSHSGVYISIIQNLLNNDYTNFQTINADINSGSTVCYIKGNFNGLIEKTNTGNTNYILAVPGMVITDTGSSSTNTMIDYNTLSGKVLCSGYNYPCIITYTPTVVFTGTPTTTTDITNMMTSLQGAYSGSNAATTNSTISNLLSSSGTTLVSLGTSVVSKIGVTSNNIISGTGNCTPGNYSSAGTQIYNLSTTLNHSLSNTGTYSTGITNGTKVYTATLTCNDTTINVSNEILTGNCDANYTWNSGAKTCDYATQVSACTGLPSNASRNTASSITQTWNGTSWLPAVAGTYNVTSSTTSCRYRCNTDYNWNGTSCQPIYPGCDSYDIKLSNGQIWSACNVGASTAYVGTALNSCSATAADCNSGLRYTIGSIFQWGRNNDVTAVGTPTATLALAGTLAGGVGHSNFITKTTVSPFDWIATQNDNLWGGGGTSPSSGTYTSLGSPAAMQGPCAPGYHVPTAKEWCDAVTTINTGIPCTTTVQSDTLVSSTLKLPQTGYRAMGGGVYWSGAGAYWASSPNGVYGACFQNNSTQIRVNNGGYRATGASVRCIKN